VSDRWQEGDEVSVGTLSSHSDFSSKLTVHSSNTCFIFGMSLVRSDVFCRIFSPIANAVKLARSLL
jgi:hypothetical protein